MKANACPVTSGWAHKPMFYWVEAIAFRSTHVCIVEGGCRIFNCSKITGGLQYDYQTESKSSGLSARKPAAFMFSGRNLRRYTWMASTPTALYGTSV